MFRSHAPRAVVAALTAVVLIVGLMASATSAAPKPKPTPTPTPTPSPTPIPTPTPTPTPNSDNRVVYFGWPETGANGQLDPSAVTTGNVFVFDVIARNDDNQTLTHPRLSFGDLAEPGGPDEDGLPAGATILDVETAGVECLAGTELQSATGYACDLPNFRPGDFISARFTIQAGAIPVTNNDILWASFKVAEKVSDQGANQNTAFASAPITIPQTNSNANGTFKGSGEPLALGTVNQPEVPGDTQVSDLEVPGATGGAISIFETDGPTGCNPGCIGQTVSANVRDGGDLVPFLRWSLQIDGVGAGINKGGVLHELDNGDVVDIRYTNASVCSSDADVDCFESYVVNKKNNLTLIVFRTQTNGKVRAN